MWKKYMGKRKIEEGGGEDWIFYYLIKKRQGVYGIFIAIYRRGHLLEWDMVEGITKEEKEAEEIIDRCKKCLVTPLSMPEALDEIMQERLE